MVNYKITKLYKITFPNGTYCIGATTQKYLSQRKAKLVHTYKQYKIKCPNKISEELFYKLMDEYGNNFTIALIDNVDCDNKDELNALKYLNARGYVTQIQALHLAGMPHSCSA